MRELLPIIASFSAGILLGLVFFWGLWLTLNHLERARHPGLRVLLSLVSRLSLALLVFGLLGRYGGWPELLAAALGFTLVRIIMLRHLRPHRHQGEESVI